MSNLSLSNYIEIKPNVHKFYSSLDLTNDVQVLYTYAYNLRKESNNKKAFEVFSKCKSLINDSTSNKLKYEIFINLGLVASELDYSYDEIVNYYEEALLIFSNRAEPYYYLSLYCNKIKKFEKSYELLHKALLLSYDEARQKYPDTQNTAYGKYLYDSLSVACYWLNKYEESIKLIQTIINDPFFNNCKERLTANLELSKSKLLDDLD